MNGKAQMKIEQGLSLAINRATWDTLEDIVKSPKTGRTSRTINDKQDKVKWQNTSNIMLKMNLVCLFQYLLLLGSRRTARTSKNNLDKCKEGFLQFSAIREANDGWMKQTNHNSR